MTDLLQTLLAEVRANRDEVRALREELRGTAMVKRIEPAAIYSVEEAAALVGMQPSTVRAKLRCRILNGKRDGVRAPWRVLGSELLKLGGKAA